MRRRREQNPELLARGPEAVLYAVLDEVVDGYGPVIAGLENDTDEIEDQLFSYDRSSGQTGGPSRRSSIGTGGR